jgi:predicted HTH domain antitoxin
MASATVTIDIPREILHATRLSTAELKQELAIALFERGKLSFGKARELADLSPWQFQQMLASRSIEVHYGLEEYEEDLKTLRETGRL